MGYGAGRTAGSPGGTRTAGRGQAGQGQGQSQPRRVQARVGKGPRAGWLRGRPWLTVRPASLLCLFMAERASGLFSRASANSRDTSTPKSASSLQPPHFQPSPGGPL